MKIMKFIIKRKNRFTITACCIIVFISACNAPSQRVADAEDDGFVNLFNEENLDGWEGDPAYWRVENGIVTGELGPDTPPLKNNTFLIWRGGYVGDFELKTEFRISANGNSGINYRSQEISGLPYVLSGYQADIDGQNRYSGQNYDERKRTTLAYRGEKTMITASEGGRVQNGAWSGRVVETLGDPDSLSALIKLGEWNKYHIIAQDNHLQHYINGTLMSDVTDNHPKMASMKGLLGIQIHTGPPMKIEYRNFRLKTE